MLVQVDQPTQGHLGSAVIYIDYDDEYVPLIDVPVTKFYYHRQGL